MHELEFREHAKKDKQVFTHLNIIHLLATQNTRRDANSSCRFEQSAYRPWIASMSTRNAVGIPMQTPLVADLPTAFVTHDST